MQLVFEKKSNEKIEVYLKENDQRKDFDYGEMILSIYKDRKVEDAEMQGAFSEIEKQSIMELVTEIKGAVEEANNQDLDGQAF